VWLTLLCETLVVQAVSAAHNGTDEIHDSDSRQSGSVKKFSPPDIAASDMIVCCKDELLVLEICSDKLREVSVDLELFVVL